MQTSGKTMALFPFPQNCVVQSVPAGSTSYNILESSLAPSQDYQVKVRSLVAPGDNFSYEGIPSEWSHPADWTSREGKKKKKKESVLAANMAAHSYRRHSCESYSWLFIGHHCASENDLLCCFCFPLAPWPVHPIYIFIAMCVIVAFFVMYCTIPACQRSVVFVPPALPKTYRQDNCDKDKR